MTTKRSQSSFGSQTGVIFTPKFPLGRIVCTAAVSDVAEFNPDFATFIYLSLRRHASCDWGDLDDEDKATNDQAYQVQWSADKGGDRIFSAYEADGQRKIWIITEADRSVTTILFPEDY